MASLTIAESLKSWANNRVQSCVDNFVLMGSFVRAIADNTAKYDLTRSEAAVDFSQKFFDEYERFPTLRGDRREYQSTLLYPPPFSTRSWHRGLILNKPHVNDPSVLGQEKLQQGSTGCLVSQSVDQEIVEGFAETCEGAGGYVYGIAADSKNSFVTADHMYQVREYEDYEDDVEDLRWLTGEGEIASTYVDPEKQVTFALRKGSYDQYDRETGRVQYTEFRRGTASLEKLPRTVETIEVLKFALKSPHMPTGDKAEIRAFLKEWKKLSPADPVSGIKLFADAMAPDLESLRERRSARAERVDDLYGITEDRNYEEFYEYSRVIWGTDV